jgi:hypothetical protein
MMVSMAGKKGSAQFSRNRREMAIPPLADAALRPGVFRIETAGARP